jgi:hypothetical protein
MRELSKPYHLTKVVPPSDVLSASGQVDALTLGVPGKIVHRCMLVFLQVVIREQSTALGRSSISYCPYNLPKCSFDVHTHTPVFDMLSVASPYHIHAK